MHTRYRRQYSGGRAQQGGVSGFVAPFLIIICVGVIVVLFLNLWHKLFADELKQGAYLHVLQGSFQMKTWGTDSYFSLDSDAVIVEGDEIRSSAGSQIIVEFFDGSLMRLAGDSAFVIETVDSSSRNPLVELRLLRGSAWFNKAYRNTESTELLVFTDDLKINSAQASLFEVENNEDQVVRAFNLFEKGGSLVVDILDEETKSKVIESEKIGLAQEIIFSDKVLKRYWQFQSPTVLTGVSDDFKQSDWYLWNEEEDAYPTEFEKEFGGLDNVGLKKVDPEVIDEPLVQEPIEEEAEEVLKEEDAPVASEVEPAAQSVSVPSVVSVSGITEKNEDGFYLITDSTASLMGEASGAAKIVVNGYTLKQFKPGDSTWVYHANSDYDLMHEGENIYSVYAVAEDGTQSETITVKVLHQPVLEEVKEVEAPL